MGFTIIGGGGSTPTPVPTPEKLTFDTTGSNYGLTPNETVTSGSTNAYGTKASLGTTTSALDGVFIYLTNVGRQGKFNLYLGASAAFAIDIPFRDGNGARVRIDYPISSGVELFIDVATTTGSQTFKVAAVGFKNSIAATATSLAAIGSASNTTSMGVTLSTASTWGLIGALAGDAQGIQIIDIGNANDAARTAGLMQIDIGISVAANSTPDSILIGALPVNCTGNTLWWPEMGPINMAGLTSGKKLYARAKLIDTTLPDPLAVQLVAKYGTPF